jgi:hypothetical protein
MQEECQAGSSLGHLHAAIATRLERPERGGQPVDVPADRGEDEHGENRCGPEPTRCVVVPGDKPGPKKHDHPEVSRDREHVWRPDFTDGRPFAAHARRAKDGMSR